MTAPGSISVDDAARRDPWTLAPPVITTDGPDTAVGAAHGRVLPLVGGKRPYTYDVSVADSTTRIYADTAEDVLNMLLGDEYATAAAVLAALDDDDTDHDRFDAAWLKVIGLRHAHADDTRVRLQTAINAAAASSGAWEQLRAAEQQMLTDAADPEGTFPNGIAELFDFVDVDGTESVGEAGVWEADVVLVINTGDYAPFSSVPVPESVLTAVDGDGRHVVTEGNPNLATLDIADTVTYMESLQRCGVLTVTVRPPEQPDEIFASLNSPDA